MSIEDFSEEQKSLLNKIETVEIDLAKFKGELSIARSIISNEQERINNSKNYAWLAVFIGAIPIFSYLSGNRDAFVLILACFGVIAIIILIGVSNETSPYGSWRDNLLRRSNSRLEDKIEIDIKLTEDNLHKYKKALYALEELIKQKQLDELNARRKDAQNAQSNNHDEQAIKGKNILDNSQPPSPERFSICIKCNGEGCVKCDGKGYND
tara:strand:- start:145 stop:774 length:630 start_codon:yes stop_codon:yes gene_type:complete